METGELKLTEIEELIGEILKVFEFDVIYRKKDYATMEDIERIVKRKKWLKEIYDKIKSRMTDR